MTRNEIAEKLQAIVEPYVQDKEAFAGITNETNLLEDLKIDSMNLVDIVLDSEEAFEIEIDDEAVEQMVTVGAAVSVVEERLAKKEN